MDPTLFDGLRELAASAFPKRCANCGRVYANAADYLQATQPPAAAHSGLKQSADDDDRIVVEVFRNCPCGSTLMEVFGDRREQSEAGQQRRARFAGLVDYLAGHGVDRKQARTELLKVLHGQESEMLAKFQLPSS